MSLTIVHGFRPKTDGANGNDTIGKSISRGAEWCDFSFLSYLCIPTQIPLDDSEPCSEALQGVIRFDPGRAQLYFCDGSEWVVSAPL